MKGPEVESSSPSDTGTREETQNQVNAEAPRHTEDGTEAKDLSRLPFHPVQHDHEIEDPFFNEADPPSQTWRPVLSHKCHFSSKIFQDVMLNLVKNPNVNTSYVFRADILYDSIEDQNRPVAIESDWKDDEILRTPTWDGSVREVSISGYSTTRTIVRRMVPRNPNLDGYLIQTCQFLALENTGSSLVLYHPHVSSPSAIPYYHPDVKGVAFQHTPTAITISLKLFSTPSPQPMPNRLLRTCHSLLSTIHKHGEGKMGGYVKRVHHDTLIAQDRVQNTYTRLKTAYAKDLIANWREVTDPGKHVFEDLSIAAFLICLWQDMYNEKTPFPGFVDIGCGNGLLIHILLLEGYTGWGFDMQARKSWPGYPPSTQQQIKQLFLLPAPLLPLTNASSLDSLKIKHHDGLFPKGTFIISNHADELTGWTPLLASLSSSPFLAIPCCSHDLSGALFRAPASALNNPPSPCPSTTPDPHNRNSKNAAETGQIKKSKMPSAYSTFTDWVQGIAESVGYVVEREMLRIPSTRNAGLVGRGWQATVEDRSDEQKMDAVLHVLNRLGGGAAWIHRCVAKKPAAETEAKVQLHGE